MARISCPDFIGRGVESDVLDHAPPGTTILIGGEAGIGKSRLTAEFCRHAAARDALVLTGGCVPFGRSPLPFTPVVEALRGFTRTAATAERTRLVERAPALTWLLPELGGEWHRQEGFESGQSWVFELLLGVLEELDPAVLVLEDLHWADRSTLDLLALRARTGRLPGCVVVGTYRSDELGPGHPLTPVLAELDRAGGFERIELTRFGRAELAAQLSGILGATPDDALVDDVQRRSDGNPFLAEELLAAHRDGTHGAPTRVHDIVLARVATLSEPAQAVLRTLSVARGTLPHAVLVAVTDLPERDLEDALREALGQHVLVRAAGAAYAFRHALTREALYDQLLVSERERLHIAFAEALEGDASPERLADLAHHWYSAGDQPKALEAAVAAGLAVDEVYAHAEALTQYERALELWNGADSVHGLTRKDLVARAAEAASCFGDYRRAVAMIETEADDPVLGERLGRYLWIAGETDRALAAYEQAARTIAPDAPERGRVLAALGHALFIANRVRPARDLCAQIADTEPRALATLGAATATLGERDEGLRMLREARARLHAAGAAPDLIFVTYSYEAGVLADGARFEEVISALEPGVELMQRHGMQRGQRSWLEGHQAHALLKLGRWAAAEALIAAALARRPAGITLRLIELLHAELALGRGDHATAQAHLDNAWAASAGDHPFAGRLHALGAALGDPDSVRAGLRALEHHDDVPALAWLCWTGLQADPADTELLDRLRAHASVHFPETGALLATATADTSEEWLAAAAHWEALKEPFPRAQCLYKAGRRHAQAAHELAAALGAQGLLDAIGHRAPHGLTERELEVLKLVGRGYTNVQIADELFISRKTASAHVSNILGKLDVSRRAEAAAVAARLDLLP